MWVRRAINATMTNIAICYKWLVLVLNINSSGQNSSKKRSVLKHYTTEPRVECFQQNNQNSASESRPSFSFQISPKLLATKSGPNFSLNILTKLQFQNLEQSSNHRRQNLNQTVAHAFLIINISNSNNTGCFFDWSALKVTKYEEKLKYLNWSANCSSRKVLSVSKFSQKN